MTCPECDATSTISDDHVLICRVCDYEYRPDDEREPNMTENRAYLAVPAPRDGRERRNFSAYLYGGSEIAESGKLGDIVIGPASGGFSMAVTRDRLASGLIFGTVFATLADARLFLYERGN